MSDQAYCCFCFQFADQAEMFFIDLSPPGEAAGERTQQMFCHGACLDRALHPQFPRHPDLLDDEIET